MYNDYNCFYSSPVGLRDTNIRILGRLKLPNKLNEITEGMDIRRGLVIDVETTGLSQETDHVTQFAGLPFDYDSKSGKVLSVHHDRAMVSMRDPGVPISREASLVTGITDEMVAGKSIDPKDIDVLLSGVDLVIAHNAGFDRPMVEKLWPSFEQKAWACTYDAIAWLEEGFTAGKLDYLGMQYGWFYDGHDALNDCQACLALLAQELPNSKRRVMSAIHESAQAVVYLIPAYHAPFDAKDLLKNRGYRWRPADLPRGKVWWTISSDPEGEKIWLDTEVYRRPVQLPVRLIKAQQRFSDRLWL